jgi:predicted DNA-binding transcriptional regulator AlpA
MSELDFIRIGEVARLAGLTEATCYNYNATRGFGVPMPCRAIGATKFWSRQEVMAWIRSRQRSRARKRKDPPAVSQNSNPNSDSCDRQIAESHIVAFPMLLISGIQIVPDYRFR